MNDQELKAQLPKNYGKSPMYRLRWVFHFADGRMVTGGWNSTSQDPRDMAAYVNKTGLLWACVEGEKLGAWTVKELARVEGEDYITSNWKSALSAPVFVKKDYKAAGSIIGLQIVSRYKDVTVFVDGQVRISEHKKEPLVNTFQHNIGV